MRHTGTLRFENNLKKKQIKMKRVYSLLKKHYPSAGIELNFNNPFQLLVATILSAQCTDKTVNKITDKLFLKYKTIEEFAKADKGTLEQIIKEAGLYKNKGKYIRAVAKSILNNSTKEVPRSMEKLTELPGVARKTANVVLFNAFGLNEGIAVDTHVSRLSTRIGFSERENPKKIEMDLLSVVPKKNWGNISHLLIAHGRKICKARKPHCQKCFLRNHCEYFSLLK